MPLRTSSTVAGGSNPSWLGSAHGTESAQSITLNVASFTKATHYPKGRLLSGLPLGKVTATGVYAPYDDSKSDGTQTLVGFLLADVPVVTGDTVLPAAILQHGIVKTANLPIAVDSAGKTDVKGQIIFN